MQAKINKSMFVRTRLVMIIVVVLFIGSTVASLIVSGVVNGEKYQNAALEQQLYDTLLTAPRGDIYDSNMNLMATSSTAWTVYITPNSISKIKDAEKRETVKNSIANGLSSILGVEKQTVLEDAEKKSYYVIVKKQIDLATAGKVRKFITDNKDLDLSTYIGLDETTKRYYPNGNLASVLLGFVGSDNQGLSGIESYYDSELTGVAGRVVAAKSAQGTNMPLTYERVEDAIQGNSLVLSIDNYIQYIAEKYLEAGVIANAAKQRGACVVMNVNTGEVLAMAVKGDFDPNEPFLISAETQAAIDAQPDEEKKSTMRSEYLNNIWRNKTVSDTYEPGSVFKVITASMALEENLVNKNSKFTCHYTITVGGHQYHCHKKQGHGTQDLLHTMVNSCNPSYIMIGQLVGVTNFTKYFEAFGLTQKTGIDLPGESLPVYHKKENMGTVELASSSFGQTFKVTPIQMITAVSAVVNGGYLVQPHVVKKVLDSNGKIVKNVATTVKRQVISATTSATVRSMMEAVVSESTSKNMYVAGYRVGGKTGTSQKVAEKIASGSDKELYISSYLSVGPIDTPEIAILVMIDEPSAGQFYGSTVAGPIGAEMMAEILPYLGYEPKYTKAELAKLSVKVPNIVGDELTAAKGKIINAGLKYKIVGSGSSVVKQMPSSSDSVGSEGTVIIYTDEESAKNNKTKVPKFIGITTSAVNTAAAKYGLNIKFAGNVSSSHSVAYKQSISVGTEVDKGTVVTVYFRDTSSNNVAD